MNSHSSSTPPVTTELPHDTILRNKIEQLRQVCSHKNGMTQVGYGNLESCPNKCVKILYCQTCLSTNVELIILNQESLDRLQNLRLSACFDFKVPSGITLREHLLSFRSLLKDLQNYIIDEIGELPDSLNLVASPEVLGYLEVVSDGPYGESVMPTILGTPLVVTTAPTDTCALMYGQHTICDISLANTPFAKCGKQSELFKPYDTVIL